MPVLVFSSEIKLPRDRKATTNKQANNQQHQPMKKEQRAKANSLKTDQEPFILFPA